MLSVSFPALSRVRARNWNMKKTRDKHILQDVLA